MPQAPLSLVNPPTPSVTAATGVGADGVVMSIIWTPLSLSAVTRAYVVPSIMAVVMPLDPLSSVKPSRPSFTIDAIVGFSGSVTLIIWTLLELDEATRAYVEESMVAVVMPKGSASSTNAILVASWSLSRIANWFSTNGSVKFILMSTVSPEP